MRRSSGADAKKALPAEKPVGKDGETEVGDGEDEEEGGEGEDEEEQEEGGEEEGGGERDDFSLAWEMLELAKTLFVEV